MNINCNEELKRDIDEIRKVNKVRKKTSYRKNSSKLDKYRGEIMRLRQVSGATFGEIQQWLGSKKRMKVARSTICRRINQWLLGER